jgi:hypothetical protein
MLLPKKKVSNLELFSVQYSRSHGVDHGVGTLLAFQEAKGFDSK